MGRITDTPASVSNAGQLHDYNGASAVSVVLVNCLLDQNYSNVALNAGVVDSYISSEVSAGRAYSTTVRNWNPEGPLDLPLSFSDGSQYNYARMTISGKKWYMFLTASYLNLTSTRYYTTIDAFTSYGAGLGYSYIVRGHAAVAASKNGDTSYCLEPEPSFSGPTLIGYGTNSVEVLGSNPAVLVVSTTDLKSVPMSTVDPDILDMEYMGSPAGALIYATGTITAGDWPLPSTDHPYEIGFSDTSVGTGLAENAYPYNDSDARVSYRPVVHGSTPSIVDGVPAPGGVYTFPNVSAYQYYMSIMAHCPWHTDGIISATLIPGGTAGSSGTYSLNAQGNVNSLLDDLATAAAIPTYHSTYSTIFTKTLQATADWTGSMPSEYDTWTKLRTFPYSAITLTNWQGAAITVPPQSITTGNAVGVHVEGVYYPDSDIAMWIKGAYGTNDAVTPLSLPLDSELPVMQVGRDAALAQSADSFIQGRNQSYMEMVYQNQLANLNYIGTAASTYVSTAYAVLRSFI